MSGRKSLLMIWLPLAIFGVFLAVLTLGLERPQTQVLSSKMIDKPLPEFELPSGASGAQGLKAADFRDGKVRLLNIFASWCVPCAAEAAQLSQIAQRGVIIEGVAIRDAQHDVDAFLARYGNPYGRIALDARSALQFNLGSSGVPETYVIDGKGIIRYQHIGAINQTDVETILAKVAEAGA